MQRTFRNLLEVLRDRYQFRQTLHLANIELAAPFELAAPLGVPAALREKRRTGWPSGRAPSIACSTPARIAKAGAEQCASTPFGFEGVSIAFYAISSTRFDMYPFNY